MINDSDDHINDIWFQLSNILIQLGTVLEPTGHPRNYFQLKNLSFALKLPIQVTSTHQIMTEYTAFAR